MKKGPNTLNASSAPNIPNTPNKQNTPKSSEPNDAPPIPRSSSVKRGKVSLESVRNTTDKPMECDNKDKKGLPQLPHLTMDDFKKCRNNNEVTQDIRFLIERKKDFAPKGPAAEQFEQITSSGLITDRWLGNIPDKQNRVPFRVANVFMAQNSEGMPYDDVVNKIDYAVSLDIPKTGKPIFVGFDVTLDDKALEDKMLRTTTDPNKSVPFGFSGLDYCYSREGEMLPKATNVPRYCLTMDLSEEKAKEYHQNRYRLRLTPPEDREKDQYKNARAYILNFNAMTRFMVLSEIYEQNKLYKAMLPPLNGKDNLTIKDAKSKLDAIGNKIESALHRAALNCPLTTWDPQSQQGLSETNDAVRAVEARRAELFQEIKDCHDSEPESEEKKQHILSLKQEIYQLVSDYMKTQDSHYSAMLATTSGLSELEQQGKLNGLKEIKPRNKMPQSYLLA